MEQKQRRTLGVGVLLFRALASLGLIWRLLRIFIGRLPRLRVIALIDCLNFMRHGIARSPHRSASRAATGDRPYPEHRVPKWHMDDRRRKAVLEVSPRSWNRHELPGARRHLLILAMFVLMVGVGVALGAACTEKLD